MRFEFGFVLKYFLPRKFRFFSSFLSLLSVLMISLVFWLSVVFLSVMGGIEGRWVEDISKVVPHLKLVPTSKYFESYYYRADAYAASSDYSLKTIGEKLTSSTAESYSIESDYPLPENFPLPDRLADGSLRDYVKEAWDLLKGFSSNNGLVFREYEEGLGCLRFHLLSDRSEDSKCIDQVSRVLPFECLKSFSLNPSSPVVSPSDCYQVILPEHFKEEGITEGSKGCLSFYSSDLDGFDERVLPIQVTGFYKSGISPFGAKTVFADSEVLSSMRHSLSLPSSLNGIEVEVQKINQIDKYRKLLEVELQKRGLSDFWRIESLYQHAQFSPIFDQLHSDRVLFLIVSAILLLVACSNIIGMLVILVNDKKKEIGILRALGASSKNMTFIFGICGLIIGALGSLFGGALAFLTIKNLDRIIAVFNFIQGRQTFNKSLFGDFMPNEVNISALLILSGITLIMAGLSGVLPALKASRMNISDVLRTD